MRHPPQGTHRSPRLGRAGHIFSATRALGESKSRRRGKRTCERHGAATEPPTATTAVGDTMGPRHHPYHVTGGGWGQRTPPGCRLEVLR